ncbi:hypothetical protein BX616_008693 [Lobosporangium transversale]|uniref:RNI-like protein n=1 Tax=Lobosporangium transversale TaxID=64571 RepID=A0A1Y2GF81_9FUNG|nr:hypothetical protein BCR41DRAFT_424742 [Lobosporangium transversale]KAF9914234.1 hypothetical protein BX616_008693 [Lobosporangium transversale]ORZ07793.1 hypothetical protein BCR41DRAFT_424742 [Lobosporangium transversale]|eukprot:XP_021878159.1 hypothetical protein BCR41DRAFT_424742 [Lobosporangium transversale]
MTEQKYQQFRKVDNDSIEKVCVRTNSVSTSNGGSAYCLWLQDIREVFPDAARFKLDGHPIPFLLDVDGNKIEPPRIAFYPDKILDVIAEVPQICSCSSNSNNNNSAIITSRNSTNLSSSQDLLPLSSPAQSSNSSLATCNNGQSEMISPSLEKAMELLQEVKGRGDEMLKLQSVIFELQAEMLKLQLEAREKDEMIISLQHQALDTIATLQKHANAILTQNFELHEYPIPRLFIILPVDAAKWDPMNVLRNKFRLHFLCECGEHTVNTSKSSHNQIHIAKHDGYEIQDSRELFHKYGKYILILLQWLKLGMRTYSAASLTPASNLVDAGINYSIDYMKALSTEYLALNNINAIDDYEGLEGPDLQQLGTFLQINKENKQLGNLYRITTETGHVKWVCFEHYRSMYKEVEQKVYANAVEMNGGKYNSHLGKATVILRSRTRAEEFFDVLANARRAYELDITFDWDWTKTDLVELEEALKTSNVSILRLDLGKSQESITKKILSTSTRYEILVRIMELSNMKVIHIVLSPDLIKLSSLQPKKSSHLHKLSLEMKPQKIGTSEFRVLVNSLKTNTNLITLDLDGSSVRNEGALALSEALKANTTLTTLSLRKTTIGSKGALALSEALKVNMALTTLNLEHNIIGDEGAVALSEALKVNTALSTLSLNGSSIGKDGALALSEALKVNKALVTLEMKENSMGKEGVVALSEALKTNTTLTTLNLEANSIGKEGALGLSEALKVNTTLTILKLQHNSIGPEGALALSEALKINTALNILEMKKNSIENEGTLALSEALKTNTTLTTLDLEQNLIGDPGVLALSEALKANTALTTLNLRWNLIGDEGTQALSEALRANTALTALGLGFNAIGKEGTLALSEALKTSPTLTSLNLWGNAVGDEGAQALSEALKTNTTLTTLVLYYNAIGNEGAQALSEALKLNTTLINLDLCFNEIGDAGALALSEALKTNTALTILKLRSNAVGNEGALALSEALRANTTLAILELESNRIGKEGALALSEALKINKALLLHK